MRCTQRSNCGGMVFVGLSWSIRFLRSTALDSVGSVLAASKTETIWSYFMTVLIMKPMSLQLNKIRTFHNSATDLAQTPMAHRTAIYVVFDTASVSMVAPELPVPYVGWKCFVAKNFRCPESSIK